MSLRNILFLIATIFITSTAFGQGLKLDTTGLGTKRAVLKQNRLKIADLRLDLIGFLKSGDKDAVAEPVYNY